MSFEYLYDIRVGDDHEGRSNTAVSGLSPKTRLIRRWHVFIVLTQVVTFSMTMFRAFFNDRLQTVNTITYCLDLIYLLYIITCFYIGYEQNGVVVTDTVQIRRRYLHTWFAIDMISVIPLEMLKYAFPALHLFSLIRCLRLLKLFSIIASFGKEPDTNKVHVAALNSFCIMAVCIQLCASLWFNGACKGVSDAQDRVCQNESENWLQLLPDVSTNVAAVSDMSFYGYAVYWSIVTLCTVGYGDLHARNITEVYLAMITMILGIFAFNGIIMTGMSSLISNLDAQRGKFYRRMEGIRVHMTHMGLPQEVQTWTYKYYYYLWVYHKGSASVGLNDDLPYTLWSALATECYAPMFKKIAVFADLNDGLLRFLSTKVKTYTYSPGQVLIQTGQVNQNAFYIENGLVQVQGDNEEKIATLLPGSLIGETNLVFKMPRNATIAAATLSEICILEHKDLFTLLADYPGAGLQVATAAMRRLQTVQYSLSDAFDLGVARNPKDVVIHENSCTDLKAKDQRILNLFMEFMSQDKRNRNVATTSSNDKKFLGVPTFRPDDRFVIMWEMIIFWSITVSIFLETWVFCFAHNSETTGFHNRGMGLFYLLVSVFIDILAVFDILLNLRIEIMTKEGYLSDLKTIFNAYWRSRNLHFDVLAVFPLDFFAFLYTGELHWKNLTFFRLNRLIWLRKVYLFFNKRENDLGNNLFVQRTAKCVFLLIFSLHICAGGLYIVGCSERCDDQASWITDAGLLRSSSNFFHYMSSVYWAATTMTNVGYGDIFPRKMPEKIMAATVCIIGLFVFNYIISQIYATLSSKNVSRVMYQNFLSSVTIFMRQQNLSLSLRKRVIDYLSLLWSRYQGEAYPGGRFLLYDLPKELQHMVLMKERGRYLSKIPFFEHAGLDFIQDIASVAVMYYFPRGEIIQYSETVTRELFCIVRGTCQILTDDLSNIVALYGEGMYFGEVGFLFGKPALMTVRAKTHCEIVSIEFDKMNTVLQKYPYMKRDFEILQSKIDYDKDLMKAVEVMMSSKQTAQEEKDDETAFRKKETVFAYEGRRYAKKSKCYIEDFGNFPIYAGAEEETVEERLLKLSKTRMIPKEPRTYFEHMEQFFCTTCPSTFLMRNAILPSSSTYIRWEIFRVLLAIVISVLTALLFSFLHAQKSIWIILYILGAFCWVDIYIRMHVAFYKDNHLQVDTLETVKHYLKSIFFLDLLSCFPWEILAIAFMNINMESLYSNLEVLHLMAYLRGPHILQLYRVPLAFSFYQSGISTEKTAVTYFKFLLYAALFLHFCTCFVFAIVCPLGDLQGSSSYDLPATKHNCSSTSWVFHMDASHSLQIETITFSEIYCFSLYFATATFCGVGYGDVHPYTPTSRIALIFVMVSTALFCGLMSGNVAAVLANADATRAAFSGRKDSLGLFLKSQQISGSLYESIIKFYTFKWIRTKGIRQDVLFEYLPSSLLGDLSTVLYAGVIAKAFGIKVKRKQRQSELAENLKKLTPLERKLSGKLAKPFFQEILRKESIEHLETDPGFIRLLAGKIRKRLFRAGDVIFRRNEYGNEMFFINKGEIDVLSTDETSIIITLKEGQYFGELSLLFPEQRATTIRASTNCDMFLLTKGCLDDVVRYYPEVLSDMHRAAERKRLELLPPATTVERKKYFSSTLKLPRDNGYFKLYKDFMREEHKKKQNRHVYTKDAYSDTFSERLISYHNSTMDPDNLIRIIIQYTSCASIIAAFLIKITMHSTHSFQFHTYNFAMAVEYMQLIEVFLKFHISYYDGKGTYISDYKSVSKNYLFKKMGFFFDMLCSFPYGLTVLHMVYGRPPDIFLELFASVRLGNALRILSAYNIIRNEEKSITSNLLLIRSMKFSAQGFIFIYIVSSVFVAMSDTGKYDEDTFLGGNKQWSTKSDWFMYGLYWAMASYSTTGYGDFHARKIYEMLFSILVMVLSKIHLIWHMGVLSSSQANQQTLQVDFEDRLTAVETFMADSNLPTAIEHRVTHFYNYIWTRTKGIKAEDLFDDIPLSIKTDILSRVCVPLLKKQQLFAHLSETFLRHLSTKMQLTSYTAGENVKKRGDVGDRMWLILYGRVKVFGPGENPKIHLVTTGQILGLHLLFGRHLAGLTATALNYVDIFHLTKIDFDIVCSYYPTVKKRLFKRITNFASVPL